LTRVTRIFQDSAFSKFAPGRVEGSGRPNAGPATLGRFLGTCDFPVTDLLLPVLFVPPSRFPVDFPGVAFTAPVFLLLFTGKQARTAPGLHSSAETRT
jgi:hypothetical protein